MTATKPGPELIDPTGTTSGHVLTSTGGSTAPTFQAGGGGWTYVSAVTASSSATVSFTGMESGYDYQIAFTGVLPATDNTTLRVEVGITGPTYRTSGYSGQATNSTSTPSQDSNIYTSFISLAQASWGNAADEHGVGHLILHDPADASTDTYWQGFWHNLNTTGIHQNGLTAGHYTTSEANTAVKAYMASGNISVGEFKLYRRANA